ncbi:Vacuolar protein sorting-associated protein ist1 [Sorochytrium milnesiophthora]
MPPTIPVIYNANKLKVQLRLAVNRLKLIQQKKGSINASQRKELAQLLEQGKEESARIRVEHIIREDFNIEAMEVVELYCELLLARFGLLEGMTVCEGEIREAVHTIVYASQRCEIKELGSIRDQFASKFGKSFLADGLDNRNDAVNPRVVQKLKVQAPDPHLVTQYLKEIAKSYKVDWRPTEEVEREEHVIRRHPDAKLDPNGDYYHYDASESPLVIPPRSSSAQQQQTQQPQPQLQHPARSSMVAPTNVVAAQPGYITQPHPYLANVMVTTRADGSHVHQASPQMQPQYQYQEQQQQQQQQQQYMAQPQPYATQSSFYSQYSDNVPAPGSMRMPEPGLHLGDMGGGGGGGSSSRTFVEPDLPPQYGSKQHQQQQGDFPVDQFPTVPSNKSPVSDDGAGGAASGHADHKAADVSTYRSDDDEQEAKAAEPAEDAVPDFDELTRRFEALKHGK